MKRKDGLMIIPEPSRDSLVELTQELTDIIERLNAISNPLDYHESSYLSGVSMFLDSANTKLKEFIEIAL